MYARSVTFHCKKLNNISQIQKCVRTLFAGHRSSQQFSVVEPTICGSSLLLNRNKLSCGSQTIKLYSTNSQHGVPHNIPMHDPEKGRLVYYGILTSQVKRIKLFSFGTSALIIGLQVPLWLDPEKAEAVKSMFLLSVVGFFGFLTPFLLNIVTKKYVTYMYFNDSSKMFTATTYSMFMRKQDVQFKAEDVKLPAVPKMFTVVYAKGTPLFLDPTSYLEDAAYIHLMGYDKPIDLSVGEDDNERMGSKKE